tara:strand:- start:924 stop:1418 length:495 start_codon:yes stop_codon:yes gene_type:complete
MFILKEYKPNFRGKSPVSGKYFKISNIDNSKLMIELKDVHTIFGLEKNFSDKIFKWCVTESQKEHITNIEKKILEIFINIDKSSYADTTVLNKSLLFKTGFPTMLMSVFKDAPEDVIIHDKGSIVSLLSIEKSKKYNVQLTIQNVFFNNDKNTISFKYIIKKIF